MTKLDDAPSNGAPQQTTDTGSLTLAALKRKKTSRKVKSSTEEGTAFGGGNEELRALEAHMLRISKQSK